MSIVTDFFHELGLSRSVSRENNYEKLQKELIKVNNQQSQKAIRKYTLITEALSIFKNEGRYQAYLQNLEAQNQKRHSEEHHQRDQQTRHSTDSDQEKERKIRRQKSQAFAAEEQQYLTQRANTERQREAEATQKWEKKIEDNHEIKQQQPKRSFLGNLFNKGRCMIGAHKGEWIFDNADHCTQIRLCTLCHSISVRTSHHWSEWEFRASEVCNRQRVCHRCQAQDFDIDHQWQQWDYVYSHNCLQRKTCSRCLEVSEQTRTTHIWGRWTHDDVNNIRSRTCQRCNERMSEAIATNVPAQTTTHRPNNTRQTQAPLLNLSGTWRANDGTLFIYRQIGNDIAIQGRDVYGRVTIEGKGKIQGLKIEQTYRVIDGTWGNAYLEVSPDGRQIQGIAVNQTTGFRVPVYKYRES